MKQYFMGAIIIMLMGALMFPLSIHAASYLMITDLGTSAEMIRRGNIEGFSRGANAIFENPATLANVNIISTSVFQSKIMTEVEYRNVSIAFNTSVGTFGFGYMDAGVDDIPKTEKHTGIIVVNGSYNHMNRVMKAGYQVSLTDDLHFGISGVGYINQIDTFTGSGYNVDVGILYYFSEIQFSLLAKNVIPSKVTYTSSEPEYSWYEGEEEMPLQSLFGIMVPFGDLRFYGQAKFDGYNTLMSASTEYQPGFLGNVLTISAGYKEFSVLDTVSNTITLGAGIDLFGLSVDYAYETSDHFEYDANNFASVGIDF